MRQNYFTAILCSLLLLFLTACAKQDDQPNGTGSVPPRATSGEKVNDISAKAVPGDVVRVEAVKAEIKAGGSSEAVVKLTVANGYHINANPASFSYLIPTEVLFEAGGEVSAEKAVYPASLTKTFAFSKDPLAVYEGEVSIKVPLRATGKAPKGDQKLSAKVRVQPCDDNACYPPRTIETSIPVKVN